MDKKLPLLEDFSQNFNNGKNVFCCIHFNNGKEKDACELLKTRPECLHLAFLAYILHDADKEEDGTLKTPHIHMCLESNLSQSKNNWIDTLANLFGVAREAVGVRSLGSERHALRYLVHIDFPDKFQYPHTSVWCTDDNRFLEALAPQKKTSPTYEELISCETEKELYELVGMQNFKKAREARATLLTESQKENFLEKQVYQILKMLAEFVGKPQYLRTGSVPLKDLQNALESCSEMYSEMRGITDFEKTLQQVEIKKGSIKR